MTPRLIGQCCCGDVINCTITKLVVDFDDEHDVRLKATLKLARALEFGDTLTDTFYVGGRGYFRNSSFFYPDKSHWNGFLFDVTDAEYNSTTQDYDEWKVGTIKYDNVQGLYSKKWVYQQDPETGAWRYVEVQGDQNGSRGRLTLTIDNDQIWHYWWDAGWKHADILIPAGTYIAPNAEENDWRDKIQGDVV